MACTAGNSWRHCAAAWVGLLLLCGPGCGSRPADLSPGEPPPIPVTLTLPTESSLPMQYSDTGQVACPESVQIQAQVSGYLKSVEFRDGQQVKAEQVLYQIDPALYQAAVDSAQAQLASAAATLLQAETEYEARVRAGPAITKIELDRSRAQRDMAQAAEAIAQAALTKAKIDLDYATIRSPINGRISKTNVTTGALISPLGNRVLTTVVSTDPMYVYFHVDERSLLQALQTARKNGQSANLADVKELNLKVMVRLDDPSLKPLEGVLDFIDNQVDPQTGTIAARAVVDNPEEILTDGMFVLATLLGKESQPVMLVPDVAIGTSLGQKFVYVVDDQDFAHYRPVEVGRTQGNMREILPSSNPQIGLSKNDRIVVEGLIRVRDGAKVQPAPAAAAGS